MLDVKQASLSRLVALGSEHIVAQVFWIVSFAVFTAIGAQIEIPHHPIPFTLQTFFVLLAGGLLGKRNGFLSMLMYLGMGAIGMPVFSSGSAGLARLLGPSGGYLLSFPIAAYLIGYLVSLRPESLRVVEGRLSQYLVTYAWGVTAMTLGLILIFAFGTAQLNAVYYHNWNSSFTAGFLIFSWWDLLKLVAAAGIWKELSRS
ncbi:MAG: biotin transporter BioY [Ignavibacteriales bacterium]|nr:biotin transporter BioY [Ignavibacteriales bacterium]